jgi:hypothetical protein
VRLIFNSLTTEIYSSGGADETVPFCSALLPKEEYLELCPCFFLAAFQTSVYYLCVVVHETVVRMYVVFNVVETIVYYHAGANSVDEEPGLFTLWGRILGYKPFWYRYPEILQ